MSTENIPLDRLRPHPCNSNVMPEALVAKLAQHIQRTGRYPPLIVRSHPESAEDTAGEPSSTDLYQILDGHHRLQALETIGQGTAECVVWEADDDEAMLLLATLNRLQGQDEPHKRAGLIDALTKRHSLKELTSLLPERIEQIKKYLEFSDRPPALRPPRPIGQMPVATHFFLMPDDKARVDRALRQLEGTREEALMRLVSGVACDGQAPHHHQSRD